MAKTENASILYGQPHTLDSTRKSSSHILRVPSNLCHRSTADTRVVTVFQKAVYKVKVLMNMGENLTRNMYSNVKRINKTNFAASCWLLIELPVLILTYLTLQRGVTGTARMLHALTHSSISRQVREQM